MGGASNQNDVESITISLIRIKRTPTEMAIFFSRQSTLGHQSRTNDPNKKKTQ